MLLAKFKITGHSMEPNLLNNQVVLVSSIPLIFLKPRVGDVAVFKYKNKTYIKRITKINSYKYFLEGDNKKDSSDSKKFGWINKKDIIGKVIHKIAIGH